MSYRGRGGFYIDKSGNVTMSRGEYWLGSGYECEMGEPACIVGTGIIREVPFNKIPVKSYDNETAGAEEAIGVFLEDKEAITDWTDEDFAEKGSHHRRREPGILLRGSVSLKNVGSTQIEANDTVLPADGGVEKATATQTGNTLGKSLQRIPVSRRGLCFVDPEYDEINT